MDIADIPREGSIKFASDKEARIFGELERVFEQYMLLLKTQSHTDLTFKIEESEYFGYEININFDDKQRINIEIRQINTSDKLKELIQLGWNVHSFGHLHKTVSQQEFLSGKFTINFMDALTVLETKVIDYSM